MKILILSLSFLFTSIALALPSKKEPQVKDSMELFNRIQQDTSQQQAQDANGRVWSLDKIVKKFKPEDLQQALLDISLESAPDKSQKMKVYKVTRVAEGSIYDQAGVKVGDYAAQ